MASCSDDIIWQVINHQFCAFKITAPNNKEAFCRNEYNVNGVCSRLTCPLANARYATVRSVNGRIYLYMKTAERQHMPNKWWERVKLSKNHAQAIEQIEGHLAYWPEHLKDKCKQRLTRLAQVAIAERRLAMKEQERHYAHTAPKVKRRETTRERKALIAAKLERAIEKELLDRLKSGAYGDEPLNVDEKIWKKVLQGVEDQADANDLEEVDEEDEELEEELESDLGEVEFVEDDEDDEVVDMEDLEKWLDNSASESDSGLSDSESDSESDSNTNNTKKPAKSAKPDAKKAKRGHVEIEYEQEPLQQQH